MKKINPFDKCPVYETDNFIFKLVNQDDAEDLFICYTDPITLSHMNNDNCSGTWKLKSSDELKYAWQNDYKQRWFVRMSIHHKQDKKVIGTFEIAPLPWGRWFFSEIKPIGILRIDLLSKYETEENYYEILSLLSTSVAKDFDVDEVIFKAPKDQIEKLTATIKNNFYSYKLKDYNFEDYYKKDVL